MKIGLVSPYDYSFPGGVVNHIAHLAHHFIKSGHTAKIIAPCLREGTRYFEEEVTVIGRPFPIPIYGSIARVPISPWLPAQVRYMLKKEKFDIVHIHEPFAPMLSLSVLANSKEPLVGTFHACHPRSRSYWVSKPIMKRMLPRLKGKIAVSKPAMEYISRYLPSEYQIIPNGIEIDRFSPEGNKREEFLDGKINILFVGRLEKRKGVGQLIESCGELKNRFSNFRLIIVGPGTRLRPGYEAQVESLGLKDHVVFTDWVSTEDLPSYYRTADIFCSPATTGESFGIILLEAMASGKPIVATDISGYASVVTHGQEGLLVPVKDTKGLASALLTLIEDKSLREQFGMRGRITAEKYSWDKVSARVMDLYKQILNGSQSQ
ncbi:MAG TPA: hypothetical protein DCX22_00635 [Dehalococcoidia bacterium]|nr:hypothetical protein [Dehalococcoidia bacterium]